MDVAAHSQQDPPDFRRLGPAGKAAVGFLVVHALLLFLPPLPPQVKGSLWSYTLGHVAVILAVVELRAHAPAVARYWGELLRSRRVLLGVGAAMGTLLLGLVVRWRMPEIFGRWSREEGIWEPLTLIVYLTSALLVVAAARERPLPERRHLHLFAAGYVLLSLEEIDYFGIFGHLIGRVDGVYVGSPHDLIALAVDGLLALWIVVLAAALLAVAVGFCLRSGYLQPAHFARTIFSLHGLWLLASFLFFALAQVEDTGVFYLFGPPRIEELLELVASLFLLGFAADLAGSTVRDRERTPVVTRQPEPATSV